MYLNVAMCIKVCLWVDTVCVSVCIKHMCICVHTVCVSLCIYNACIKVCFCVYTVCVSLCVYSMCISVCVQYVCLCVYTVHVSKRVSVYTQFLSLCIHSVCVSVCTQCVGLSVSPCQQVQWWYWMDDRTQAQPLLAGHLEAAQPPDAAHGVSGLHRDRGWDHAHLQRLEPRLCKRASKRGPCSQSNHNVCYLHLGHLADAYIESNLQVHLS